MKKINPNLISNLLIAIIFCLLLSNCTNKVANWPQFRGSGSAMVVNGESLPTEWGDSLNVRWKFPMKGESWSSPIIYGEKVFYTSATLLKKAPLEIPDNDTVKSEQENSNAVRQQEQDNQLKDIYQLQLSCLDLETGNELWNVVSFEGNPKIKKHAASTYACETPVTNGKHVYVYYGMHGVYCYNMKGDLVWNKDIGVFETLKNWGTGSSPVLFNNILFIQVDNEENSFIIALDALSGDEKWRKNRDEKTTYSTPVIWKNELRAELVTLGSSARSYDPETGKLLWEMRNIKGMSIPSAVFDEQHIYFGNAGGPGKPGNLYAVKAGADGDITLADNKASNESIIWSDTIAGLGNPSPVLHNNLIYLLGSRGGGLSCVDALNGELVYKQKVEKVGACWATPWIYNDHLYFYDERGRTHVIKTGRDFEVVSNYSFKDKFWASIAVAKDAYIFKGVENIYCVGI